ncbi:MAG TPA: hypothetical protein VHE61_05630 [Opitutaceae bacterium]|nr:hypothetical protein [Opitutaceae bacterium]
MTSYPINLLGGWACFLAGALSGMLIGLRFHRPEWLGGYDSLPRRMVRLGHIAFFGLGLINILFALSNPAGSPAGGVGSVLLLIGAATMPTNCFLSAWRGWFRHAFFIPAGATAGGILAMMVHLL